MECFLAFLGLCICAFAPSSTLAIPPGRQKTTPAAHPPEDPSDVIGPGSNSDSGHIAIAAIKTPYFAQEVLSRIRNSVNPDILPASGDEKPVSVSLGFDLLRLREVDPDRNEVELICRLYSSWTDPALSLERLVGLRVAYAHQIWMTISIKDVWRPDITSLDYVTAPEVLSPELAQLDIDGTIIYAPHLKVRFLCDLAHVERDSGANCTLTLHSWLYDQMRVGVEGSRVDHSHYKQNRQYEILAKYAEGHPEGYPEGNFTFTIRKRRFSWDSLSDLSD